ncbi:MAG: VWA domain-containing protein [Candidatus Rokubacteria bacterium]|nr:VWA domain-containing protein [Candidatus Rokubacteria bacterium]
MPWLFRYSKWDGQQNPGVDADDVLASMADDVLADGDPWRALQRLMHHGMRPPNGTQRRGLQDVLKELRKRRQERLERYDLGSSLDDIKKKLEDVVKTEREGIDRRVNEAREGAEQGKVPREMVDKLERAVAKNKEQLDGLPPDPGGQMRDLQQYDFVDPEAKKKFEELLQSLRDQMLKPFMQGMQNAMKGMTPEDMARMREMLQDLNRMLRERAEGNEPDFEPFKQKWGEQFPGAESLDDLLEQLGKRMAQMQSLMQSLTPGQRQELDDMMRAMMMQDERLEGQLRQLAQNLGDLLPMDEMSRRYPFQGDEDVSLEQAMKLMDEMSQLDQLERELRGVRDLTDLDRIEGEKVEELLGEEAANDLARLKEMAQALKDAGYLEGEDDDLKLTARAIRKIADKALRDIFARLTKDRFGGHQINRRGAGGEQTDETKAYEFGDPFLLDLRETVMNAVERQGAGSPVKLAPSDFEVHRTELRTQAATVVMLDMSRSMLNNGYFLPAKKVALALGALIRSQYPRDALYIVGFSLYAREFTAAELPTLSWSEWNIGTNMHAGLFLARQLLARHRGGNRQVLMVTDGEPTAHLENGEADFQYPPSRRTVEETLREVGRCTRDGITINTFMLERTPWLAAFVEQMTKINRGRAFYVAPENLGEYVVVDFVEQHRRRRAG